METQQETDDGKTISTMMAGIGMTRETLAKALAKEKVFQMDAEEILGSPMNPDMHEAVATVRRLALGERRASERATARVRDI